MMQQHFAQPFPRQLSRKMQNDVLHTTLRQNTKTAPVTQYPELAYHIE
jgi:hypothetical protein